jgi:glycosyltransferase involved in cell wall biosynthesis
MNISVIIATHNRCNLLDECLAHMARQTFGPGDEVVVVNNGSTDGTDAAVARHACAYSAPLVYVEEPTPGKSNAIAAALRVAKGDVLAFTDDDVNVAPTWLEAIRRAMIDSDTALVGGPVEPRWERCAPTWLRLSAQTYGRLTAPLAILNYGAETIDLGSRTALGANLAVRRDVFERSGGFAPHLGKLRGTLLSGEDHELCRRVQAAGLRAVYCPDVRVFHWVPVARMRLRYYLSWYFWSGIANAAMDGVQPARGRTILGIPLYLLRRCAIGVFGAIGAAIVGNLAGAIERGVDVAFAAGYAAQRWGFALALPGAPAAEDIS